MSRILIRGDDYYGGTLEVLGPDEPPDGFVEYNFCLRWETWGGYGSQEIRLTWREALAMRDALSKVLQAAGVGEAVQATKGTEA